MPHSFFCNMVNAVEMPLPPGRNAPIFVDRAA